MKKIILPYIIGYILLSTGLLWMFFTHSQEELHLIFNSWHTRIGDIFFKYYTQLAEWPLYIIGLIPLLLRRYWWTILYAISELTAGAIIQTIKYFVDAPRPAAVFEKLNDIVLPVVEGVKLHHSDSFPSGHASSFFIFFTLMTLIFSFRCYKHGYLEHPHTLLLRTLSITAVFMLLALAVIGAYSRVYLSQHFFIDVYVGSLIGITVPCVMVSIFSEKLLNYNGPQKQKAENTDTDGKEH